MQTTQPTEDNPCQRAMWAVMLQILVCVAGKTAVGCRRTTRGPVALSILWRVRMDRRPEELFIA